MQVGIVGQLLGGRLVGNLLFQAWNNLMFQHLQQAGVDGCNPPSAV